ncbi:hypothetical protein QBC46DRAFT_401384 [Diplogelasinospora grovesii]|uniref:Uncharacterized protein n=1 Tax=Diplogelasinospora grovesii TaxID=303347 RepID=A0AAN6MUT2_9PEZI|nr:hypothetical protein QBC46DRAFT_401384 [Diplogelasinospora grovesii]
MAASAPNTAEYHILQHPTNSVHNTRYTTGSDKEWARRYKPVTKLIPRTYVADGITYADFEEAFLPLYDDDVLRMNEPAVAPNSRGWRLEVEADCENWFNSEISNVVLAAWTRCPSVLQTSHNKPLTDENISENIDSTYSTKIGNRRVPLAIGEMKRNLITPQDWQTGDISSKGAQKKLSQELRGYAHKYQCPQVFCFDGQTLLLLQFRASKLDKISDEDCPVDCWVLPRTSSYCTLRYALYRLLAQGWRRCQGMSAAGQLTVGGLREHSREFFSGWPVWRVNGVNRGSHPGGYQRSVDAATGSLRWTHEEYPDVTAETWPFWGGESAQDDDG